MRRRSKDAVVRMAQKWNGPSISGKYLSYDAAAGHIRAVRWRAWLERGAGGGDSGKEVARLGPHRAAVGRSGSMTEGAVVPALNNLPRLTQLCMVSPEELGLSCC